MFLTALELQETFFHIMTVIHLDVQIFAVSKYW